jgi:hypothetical protein
LFGTTNGGASWASRSERIPDAWKNVVATLEGSKFPSQIYILCGHYDSISDDPMVRAPGADDNASGTSLVVSAARILKDYSFESTIRFICFSGEETGLYGSNHYARDARARREDIRAVLTFDMIAYGSPSAFLIGNPASSSIVDYCIAVRDSFVSEFPLARTIDDELRFSDHSSFWDTGYRALLAIEIDHWDNRFFHTARDLAGRLNFSLAADVTRLAVASAASLAQLVAPPVAEATIDIEPNTLNLGSSGRFVTCYIELPPEHSAADIDVSSVVLNGSVDAESRPHATGDYDKDEVPDLMVKFSRSRVQETVSSGDSVEIRVSGDVAGFAFQGRDIVRIVGEERHSLHTTAAVPVPRRSVDRSELHHNYPDPLNPATTIRYALASPAAVCLEVFDVRGNLVRNLVNEQKRAGRHVSVWNGTNSAGDPVSSGVYFYRLTAGGFTDTKKMVVLR